MAGFSAPPRTIARPRPASQCRPGRVWLLHLPGSPCAQMKLCLLLTAGSHAGRLRHAGRPTPPLAGCATSRLPPGPSASCPAPGFRGPRAANPELGPSASARTSTRMCPGRRLRPPAPDPRRAASGRGRVPRTNWLRVPAGSPPLAAGRPAPAVSGSPLGRLLPTFTPASPPPAPAPQAGPTNRRLHPRPGPPALPAPAPAMSAPAGSARPGHAPVLCDSAPSGVPGGLPRRPARARTAGSTRHPAGSAACRPRPATWPPAGPARIPASRLAAPRAGSARIPASRTSTGRARAGCALQAPLPAGAKESQGSTAQKKREREKEVGWDKEKIRNTRPDDSSACFAIRTVSRDPRCRQRQAGWSASCSDGYTQRVH
nr:translation initiation factor IF-2-like [Aegilops tauschii subsp. strangulata]